MPAASRDVPTGRRMNGSETFTAKIQADHLHRPLQRIGARVPAQLLSSPATATRLVRSHRDDGLALSNGRTDRDKGKLPAWYKESEIARAISLRRSKSPWADATRCPSRFPMQAVKPPAAQPL